MLELLVFPSVFLCHVKGRSLRSEKLLFQSHFGTSEALSKAEVELFCSLVALKTVWDGKWPLFILLRLKEEAKLGDGRTPV